MYSLGVTRIDGTLAIGQPFLTQKPCKFALTSPAPTPPGDEAITILASPGLEQLFAKTKLLDYSDRPL